MDIFGVLSSFRLAENFWGNYETFAIAKIEEATLKLRGSLFYVKDLSPDQAQSQLKSLVPFFEVLEILKKELNAAENPALKNFKKTTGEFFQTVAHLQENLEDVAFEHHPYEMSTPALEDWSRPENDHWDNY